MKDNDDIKKNMEKNRLTQEEIIRQAQQCQMTYGPPAGLPPQAMGFMSMNFPTQEQRPSQWISKEQWLCTCGSTCSGNFCGECGRKAPIKPPQFV